MPADFTAEETWRGGLYELAMEYAGGSDALLDAALRALWDVPGLQGCWLRRDAEPASQPRVAPALAGLVAGGHLLGMATLPNGQRVACGTFLVREDQGSDWLGFYVPVGAVGRVYDVGGYPFDGGLHSRAWREPVETWLAEIGRAVFAAAPFLLGVVGFEVSATVTAQDLSAQGLPAQRLDGYLLPAGDKLTFYPTNQWQPQHLPAS
jgi:hypothetical protein